MDFTQYILLGTVIAGATELLNRLRAKDYWVAASIATSAVIGGVFGYFNVEGVTSTVAGIAIGLGVSGTFSAIGMVKGKSVPAPSTLTDKTV